MKYFILLRKVLFASAIILIAYSTGFSQTNWTYYSDNPLLRMDTTFMWGAYGQPTVIVHNDTVKMWYAVSEGVDQFDPIAKGRIHYAWSLDGIIWNKYPGNPVLDVGGTGQWDGQWLDTPEILWDGNEFKLFYYGDSTYYQGQSHTALGMATSTDGINWIKQGKILEKGNPGEWDGKFIESPAAYYNPSSGLYALVYTGIDTSGFARLGLAVSTNGTDYIKYPNYPVVSVGSPPSWNDIAVATPALIETNGIIEMWYCGVSNDNGQYDSSRVGYAVTLDGINWIEYPGNPVLVASNNIPASFWAIDVLFDSTDNMYKLYYEDFWLYGSPADPDTVNAIYYATAPRDVLFSSTCNSNINNDTIIAPGASAQLLAYGGDLYAWSPAEYLNNPFINNPLASPDSTTTFTVLIVSDSCITKEEMTVYVDYNIKVAEQQKEEMLTIYPNPFSERTTIYYDEHFHNSVFKLYNSVGQIVDIQNNINNNEIIVERNNLPVGIYLFQLINQNNILTGKIVVSD